MSGPHSEEPPSELLPGGWEVALSAVAPLVRRLPTYDPAILLDVVRQVLVEDGVELAQIVPEEELIRQTSQVMRSLGVRAVVDHGPPARPHPPT